MSSIDFNLAELGRVVQRLKDQLRKLEIETEAQILHRHVDSGARRDDFDPLELDRYSSIQQFSRALGGDRPPTWRACRACSRPRRARRRTC